MLTVKNYGTDKYSYTPGVVYSGFVTEWSEVEKAGILSTDFDGAATKKVFLIFHASYLADRSNPPAKGDSLNFHYPNLNKWNENVTPETPHNVVVTRRRS